MIARSAGKPGSPGKPRSAMKKLGVPCTPASLQPIVIRLNQRSDTVMAEAVRPCVHVEMERGRDLFEGRDRIFRGRPLFLPRVERVVHRPELVLRARAHRGARRDDRIAMLRDGIVHEREANFPVRMYSRSMVGNVSACHVRHTGHSKSPASINQSVVVALPSVRAFVGAIEQRIGRDRHADSTTRADCGPCAHTRRPWLREARPRAASRQIRPIIDTNSIASATCPYSSSPAVGC